MSTVARATPCTVCKGDERVMLVSIQDAKAIKQARDKKDLPGMLEVVNWASAITCLIWYSKRRTVATRCT